MMSSNFLRVAILGLAVFAGGTAADSTRARIPGYGGIIPLPVPEVDSTSDDSPIDVISLHRVEQARSERPEARADHGRVLYAKNRAATKVTDRTSARRICPQQTLVQGRAAGAPNS